MTKMILNAETSEQLRKMQGQVELLDESGNLVGYFTSGLEKSVYASVEIPISDEELRRRSAKGGGRKLADIVADLDLNVWRFDPRRQAP